MRWVLRLKLTQHPQTFGRLLLNTQNFPIVEQSRTDPFWGALKVKDARDMLHSERSLLDVSDLNIFSRPVSQWLAEGD